MVCGCSNGKFFNQEYQCKDVDNCEEPQNITGRCLKAKDGFFVKKEGSVEACDSIDQGCQICEDGYG